MFTRSGTIVASSTHGIDAGGRQIPTCRRAGVAATLCGGEAGVRQVRHHPPRPAPDGRTLLALSPLELLAALARLILPPRIHRHRYHGVLAPNAALRARVVALGRDDDSAVEAAASAGVYPPAPPQTIPWRCTSRDRRPGHHAPAGCRPLPPGAPLRPYLRRLPSTAPTAAPACVSSSFSPATSPWAPSSATSARPPHLRPSHPRAARPSTTSASTLTTASTSTQASAFDPTEPEPVPDFDPDQSHGD